MMSQMSADLLRIDQALRLATTRPPRGPEVDRVGGRTAVVTDKAAAASASEPADPVGNLPELRDTW